MNKDTNKNLKDPEENSIKDKASTSSSLVPVWNDFSKFYSKTDKLITALYMVTDMIEKDEPIRNKLRTLGLEILSDMTSNGGSKIISRVQEVLSFMDIASAMNLISEMNSSILKKEFLQLQKSLQESSEARPVRLEEFLADQSAHTEYGSQGHRSFFSLPQTFPPKGQRNFKGQTRIGVQKAGTLMQALSDKTYMLAGNDSSSGTATKLGTKHNFEIQKKERRNKILDIIKNYGGSATIKDIKIKISSGVGGVSVYGEKTLQRELLSMTKDGVLNKTGEKRWSRYFLGIAN